MPEDSPFSFASIEQPSGLRDMPDPPELQNLHQNLAQMRDFQVNSKLQADLSADPTAGLKSMKIKNDGTFQAEGSVQALQSLMKDRQDLNQIRGAFHQQAMQYENRARMQENQPPWVQLATSLAGNLATAPNMPGWVQALGRTSQELNPRADQLRGVERQIMGQEAGIGEHMLNSDVAQIHQQAMLSQQQGTLLEKHEKEIRETANKITSTLRLIAKPGEALDPKAVEQIVALNDPNNLLTPQQRQAAVVAAGGMATTAKAGLAAAQGRKIELATVASDLGKSRDADKSNLELGNRMAVLNQAFQNSVSPTKLQFMKDEATFKGEIQKELMKAKDSLHLNAAEFKTLESVHATAGYVGRTMRMLDDPAWREVAGPIAAWNPETKNMEFVGEAALPQSWTSEKRAQVATQLAHEIPRIGELAFPGGISRMAGTEAGRKFIAAMGANINQRPDQMQAILKIVMDANMDRAKSVVAAHPGAFSPDSPYGSLVGTDNPDLQGYWNENIDAFGHGMAQPSPFQNGRTPGASTPVTKPKGKYFDAATGKWVTP